MNESSRVIALFNRPHAARIILRLALIAFLALPALALPATPAAAQERCRRVGGFDVCGRFLDEWSRQGSNQAGVYVNGLPLSARQPEVNPADGKTYDVQWFERARFEAHPENKPPYDVLFGLLGANLAEGRSATDPGTGKLHDPSNAPFARVFQPDDLGPARLYFPETGHTLSGKVLEYWSRYGGLKQFGFPLSEPFDEISPTDGKTYMVQYFERNRFELHPEKPAPYDVLLGLLGAQQYRQRAVPGDALPIAPPSGVTSAKDTLVVATGQEPGSLFYMEEGTTTSERHVWPITFLDGLVGMDDKGDGFPLAAWYVPTIENGGAHFVGTGGDRHLVVKYRLRPGIRWSDGEELTSADAIFAYKFILDDHNAYPSEYLRLSSVDNPGKYTVVYNYLSNNQLRAIYNDPRTEKPSYTFATAFLQTNRPVISLAYSEIGRVLPRRALSKIDPNKVQDSPFARNPVGYGPFMVDHWTPQTEMLLVQNPYYNLTATPPIKRILIKEGVALSAAYEMIKAGDIDAIAGDTIYTLSAGADDFRANGVTFDVALSAAVERLDLDFDFAPFKEKVVRQAVIQAIDRARIVKEVFKGIARTMNGVIPPVVSTSLESPTYARDFPGLAARYKLPVYPFDPAAANKLLDDAGWVRGADGIRAKGGKMLKFRYATSYNPTRLAVAGLVKDDLKQVGMEVQIGRYYDPSGFGWPGDYSCQVCEHMVAQNDEADFSSWDANFIPSDDYPGLPNIAHYRNPAVTAANQAYVTDPDPLAHAEASALAQVTIMTDIASIAVAQYPQIEIYRSNLQNRKVAIACAPQTWNITQWYFK